MGCIDSGCSMIVMHRDVWKNTNTLLLPQEKTSMQSANGQRSFTLGCVRNMRIAVGSVSGLFQVHISERLPVGLLLGRPFLTLFSCTTRDFDDGYQELALTCPNTAQTVVVTTRPSVSRATGFRESRT
ncbi:hypothetical protein CALVIDRAFT_491530 [Calocera viscosa TUFC12733]|uniref:Aspartic peptidase DDI1-type domain-containing protein n=1 Tax=Calocera viscosa (strain TUFC12733) TaxID=1330018 RepID=A0A167FMT1_CALVF|nr:hypothetical protein CALVIDRAFT_491530 [Calocera viscosa TUFC12733]